MSLETTLEIIKKHISDTLDAQLLPAKERNLRDGDIFNVHMSNNIITVFIPCIIASYLEDTRSINEYLENLNIASFVKNNPGKNISLSGKGVAIDSKDR